MNTFANAVINQPARTVNGMKARKSTASANVDLFFKIGASRGKNIVSEFIGALVESEDTALRIAQWARDVRGGAGERELFRQVLKHLAVARPNDAKRLMAKVPELGRYDDLFALVGTSLEKDAFEMIKIALAANNGLAAKWTPRKGTVANKLREYLGWSPKFYRKRLVELTKVVETAMCANKWDEINFSHVPSLAAARYKKAFNRHTEKYAEYVASLVKGDKPEVKVNAGAVYPYDVIKGVLKLKYGSSYDKTERDLIVKQWEALENFVGDANVLPLVDVSGSMCCAAGKNSSVSCIDVAVSLGLYLADKNTGKFKDTFLTFSSYPELLNLKGNVIEKAEQMVKSTWGMSTNLNRAMQKIVDTAIAGKVPAEEMPKMLLVLSDMQFDACAEFDDSAMEMTRRKFEAANYEMPLIVFWNINAYDNVPVSENDKGVALVSGFSPAIMKAVLSADMSNFTPEAIMNAAIMIPRYDI